MNYKFALVLFFFCISYLGLSQNNPDYELRAAWVATVSNLDWPNSGDKNNIEAQKLSFFKLVESLEEVNINTVFLQVRTECDAFYNSEYEPWSRYLTGTQGKNPGYDPLKYAIDVCHNKGIELHVWLNPYRINASKNDNGSYYDSKHVYKKHPNWAIEYSDGKKILNPGLPQVQKYIKQVAGDIINKYDIDGLHFDDYFYAYGGTPIELDENSYLSYGSEYSNIGDFRRGSINKMIKGVMDTILSTKPYIRFGVSPFGIYGNNMNPAGVTGLNAYHVIYCDPLAWLKEQSVDYINPQLYWTTGGHQDFGKLLPWWANWAHQYNRDVYAGHGIYRLDDNPALSYHGFENIIEEYKDYFNLTPNEMMRYVDWSLEEVIKQIGIVRDNRSKNANGSVFFRAKDFNRVNNLKKKIADNVYKYNTLLPEQYWKNSTKPGVVSNIKFEKLLDNNFYSIVWDGGDTLSRFAIYNTTNSDYPKPENLLGVTFNNYYIPPTDSVYNDISISIVKVNRFWKIGDQSEPFSIPKPEKPILIKPNNNFSSLSRNDVFSWNTSKYSNKYEIEFATDVLFTNITNKFNTKGIELLSSKLTLEGEETYYWRVRSKNISGYSEYSEIRSLTTGFPKTPSFINPKNDDKNISLDIVLNFGFSNLADSLFIQLSRGGSEFSLLRTEIDTVIKPKSFFTPNSILQKYTVYYGRIKSKNIHGNSNWSDVIKFKTLMPVPDKTKIIQPKNNTGLNENLEKVEFLWNKSINATHYVFQISETNDFSNLIKDENVYSGLKYLYYSPKLKTWMYARVAGKNIGGNSEWSELIHFTLDNTVSLVELYNKNTNIFIFPNPSNNNFNIKIDKKTTNLHIEIFNSNSQLLLNKTVSTLKDNQIIPCNIEQFICQPCFIRVTSEKVSKTIKLIKN